MNTTSFSPHHPKSLVSKGDYWYAVCPDHPNATVHGYVLYHRVLCENELGRYLTKDEVVHHIDGNKKNNDTSNLRVELRSEHTRGHRLSPKIHKCAVCEKGYIKESRKGVAHFVQSYGYCGISCYIVGV